MKKLRILLCLLMFYCFEAKSRELNAVQEILWDGQIIGYQTQDSNVDFISPFYWKIVSEKTFIEMKSEHEYFLNILFKPDYSSANNYILNQKISNPNKIFLPLPWRLEKAELHLIDLLGSVEIQLTPSLLNQSPYIYFKVLLSESQLETIKKLAQSEVPIVGSSEYSFVRRDEVIHSSAAINGKLSPEFFKNSKSKNFGLEWLIDLFKDYDILLHGAIDGYFSLGRVNLSIKNSILNINLDPSKTEFQKVGDALSLIPTDSNISGKVTLEISEFSTIINVNITASLNGNINLKNANISLDRLRIDSITSPDNSNDKFVVDVLNKYLTQKEILEKLSAHLEENLKNRILLGDLFY